MEPLFYRMAPNRGLFCGTPFIIGHLCTNYILLRATNTAAPKWPQPALVSKRSEAGIVLND